MKVWIEEDYECYVVTFWTKEGAGVEAEIPEEVLKTYEAAADQWRKAQQALLKYVK